MPQNCIESREEWLSVDKKRLARAKPLTDLRDEINEERQELPVAKAPMHAVLKSRMTLERVQSRANSDRSPVMTASRTRH